MFLYKISRIGQKQETFLIKLCGLCHLIFYIVINDSPKVVWSKNVKLQKAGDPRADTKKTPHLRRSFR